MIRMKVIIDTSEGLVIVHCFGLCWEKAPQREAQLEGLCQGIKKGLSAVKANQKPSCNISSRYVLLT